MALDKQFWDILDIFCDFFWDTYWLLLAQAEINEKLRDSPYIFWKFFRDTSRQIFTLSPINDIVYPENERNVVGDEFFYNNFVQNGTVIVNVRDLDHETGWSVPRLSIRDARYSDEFRMSLMRRELLPETPKLFCLNLLLDQHYFNRQLVWENLPKGQHFEGLRS